MYNFNKDTTKYYIIVLKNVLKSALKTVSFTRKNRQFCWKHSNVHGRDHVNKQ